MASRQGMIRTTIALGIALRSAPADGQCTGGWRSRPRRLHNRAEALHRPVHRAAVAVGLHRTRPRQAPGTCARCSITGAGIWACCAAIRTRSGRVARISGQGHHASGWAALQRDEYRSSINYQTSGERIQITGTRPNGQSCSTIEVLSGAHAWNEDIPGAELIKGKGTATPMAAATRERMIRLWAGPQGALKSALAGIQDHRSSRSGRAPRCPPMSPRPGRRRSCGRAASPS